MAQGDGTRVLTFLYLGAKHMVTGYDHLLFLAGVVFFLRSLRQVAGYVTLFALGHSLTRGARPAVRARGARDLVGAVADASQLRALRRAEQPVADDVRVRVGRVQLANYSGREPAAPAASTISATSGTHYVSARAFRSDLIDIPLGLGAELEYKVTMAADEELVYSWSVVGDGKVYYDFHGESEPPAAHEESYLKVDGAHEAFGALRAPFAGIHGWYWLNDSDAPIVVRLRLSGYYELASQFASIGRPVKP